MTDASDRSVYTPLPVHDPESGLTFNMPFFYDSVSLLWTYYLVDKKKLQQALGKLAFTIAGFKNVPTDKGLVSLNFQNYTAHLGMMLSTVNEIEFNIHGHPKELASLAPGRGDITLEDYIIGQEQTKQIGGFRLWVPADSYVAVRAGRLVFGERKFLTNFHYDVPAPNNPGRTTWQYTCLDPGYKPPTDPDKYAPKPADIIFSLEADFTSLHPTRGWSSPLTLYSELPGGPDEPPGKGRLSASRWNMLGLYEAYLAIPAPTARAKLTLTPGKSVHAMRKHVAELIGDAPAVAARVFQSPPAAIENRAFWVGSK